MPLKTEGEGPIGILQRPLGVVSSEESSCLRRNLRRQAGNTSYWLNLHTGGEKDPKTGL